MWRFLDAVVALIAAYRRRKAMRAAAEREIRLSALRAELVAAGPRYMTDAEIRDAVDRLTRGKP